MVAPVGPMARIDCPVDSEAVAGIGHNDNLGRAPTGAIEPRTRST